MLLKLLCGGQLASQPLFVAVIVQHFMANCYCVKISVDSYEYRN
jgi:hypothetical protein